MDFHQFEYVMAIVEEKSISKAAKKLYISQPSLSQYIIRLEEQLGIKLFDRTTNPIILTFAGEKYLETAKNILNLNKQLKRELGDIADSKKGRLTIGIPIQTGRHILPLVLPEFHKRFPQIELSVEEDNSIQLEQLLIEGKLDIAILNLPIQDERIRYETISVEKMFLVVPPGHPICSVSELEKQNEIHFNCLKDEKFILLKPGNRMRLIADEIFNSSEFKPNIILEIANLDTAHRLAAAGMGFTFIPENTIDILNAKQYKNYFLIDDITYTLVLAYRNGEYLTKAACEFITIVKEIMGLKHKAEIDNNKVYNKISTSIHNVDI